MTIMLKNSLRASAILAASALATPAISAIPVPIFDCLFPPSYRGENICVTDWIFIPIYW